MSMQTNHRINPTYIYIYCTTHTSSTFPDSIQVDDLPGSLLSWLQKELMPRHGASSGMSWSNSKAMLSHRFLVDRRLVSIF